MAERRAAGAASWPNDVLLLLFRLLSPSELAAAGCVCLAWRAAAASSWRVLAPCGREALVESRLSARWEEGRVAEALLRGHASRVLSVASCASHDGVSADWLASGSADCTARLWRRLYGSPDWASVGVVPHASPVVCVAWASSASLLTATSRSATAWRVASEPPPGSRVSTRALRAFPPLPGASPIKALLVCVERGELFIASNDGGIAVYDLLCGSLLRLLRREGGAPARSLVLLPSASVLVSAGADGAQACSAADGRRLPWRLDGPQATFVCSAGGCGTAAPSRVLVGYESGAVVSWDLRSGTSAREQTRHYHRSRSRPVVFVASVAGGAALAVVHDAGDAHLIDDPRGGATRLLSRQTTLLRGHLGETGDAPAQREESPARPPPARLAAPPAPPPPGSAVRSVGRPTEWATCAALVGSSSLCVGRADGALRVLTLVANPAAEWAWDSDAPAAP